VSQSGDDSIVGPGREPKVDERQKLGSRPEMTVGDSNKGDVSIDFEKGDDEELSDWDGHSIE